MDGHHVQICGSSIFHLVCDLAWSSINQIATRGKIIDNIIYKFSNYYNNTWCHGSHLCFHPRGSPSVSKPKCSFCLFILEIWVLCIHLHPEIQRNWLSEVLLTVYAIQAIITIKLYWFLLSTRGLWKKSSSFTFSDLWSHHCEGSEKNSLQSFSFWAAWTTGTG